MVTDPETLPRQAIVYRKYLRLQSLARNCFSGSLGGRLVLGAAFNAEGEELALATTIAGGTFLAIGPDAQQSKAALRHGACDFLVNTLDEALRVLKNEIRKHTPLSVSLLGTVEELLPAMVERGVQPDIVAEMSAPEKSPAAQARDTFLACGAQPFPADAADAQEGIAMGEAIWTTAMPRDLRRLDAVALETLPTMETVRRLWLERAGAYFDRQTPRQRVLHLSPAEHERLLQAFQQAGATAAFPKGATLCWHGSDGLRTSDL
jgi:urocanate hydratase